MHTKHLQGHTILIWIFCLPLNLLIHCSGCNKCKQKNGIHLLTPMFMAEIPFSSCCLWKLIDVCLFVFLPLQAEKPSLTCLMHFTSIISKHCLSCNINMPQMLPYQVPLFKFGWQEWKYMLNQTLWEIYWF